MAIIENRSKNYLDFISEINTGQVKVPQFQRQFVWDIKASASLLDSMLKGYPIGTFILWRTDEQLRAVRNIGGIELPLHNQGEQVNYVLDGQQRITSLFAAIKGVMIVREKGARENFSHIYINLNASEDDEIVITDITDFPVGTCIQLKELNSGIGYLAANFESQFFDKIEKYKNIINAYQFNIIELKQASISVATEVFTRLNVGGKSLSLFEIMVAKTYHFESSTPTFDLYEKYEQLLRDLRPIKYNTIASSTVLQVVSVLISKGCTRKHILNLDKQEFIRTWDRAENSIKLTVDFFRSYGIPVSDMLPYNALIVPFSYFFSRFPNMPSGDIKRYLEDFFWRCSLGQRYTSGVENKIANDLGKIDQILVGILPRYEWGIDVSPQFIRNQGWFSTGRSFIKAILCLYAMQKPRSFETDLDVNINNDWLKRSNSKNYHHFFPMDFLKRNYADMETWQHNHIANITIVDDHLNKNRIRAKAPAIYIAEFMRNNPNLTETLETHLINDLDGFGITANNYEKFFHERTINISNELQKRVIKQDNDSQMIMLLDAPMMEEEDSFEETSLSLFQ